VAFHMEGSMSNLLRRIEKLEQGTSDRTIQVLTEDGKPLRIRRDDILPLTTASFRRCYAALEGEPMPVSPFDAKMDLLKRAGVARTNEPMIELACDALRRNNE
jgi:hypothetical protein